MLRIALDTDIGRDCDDALALLFLLSRSDARVAAVTTTPGTRSQAAFVRFLLKECGRGDTPVGSVADSHHGASPLTRCHVELLRSHGAPEEAPPDAPSWVVLEQAFRDHPEATLLTTGPLTNVARFLAAGDSIVGRSVTMGGYHPRQGHPPSSREFNFDADRPAALAFLASPNVRLRQLVGRDITHDPLASYDADLHRAIGDAGRRGRPFVLMHELMSLRGGGGRKKLLHDPLAAAAAVRPDVAQWREASSFWTGTGWSSADRAGTGTWVAGPVDYARFKAVLLGEE